ncbi:mechanosensitive ion channel family protein [Magnetospirillum sp. UT-4]|uniref:mechanosensitive ion channel family protein n=1 Tax=Magnetospirillum sp. UT-4 TaxID=2681467 RepID=UPI001384B678
MPPLRLVLASVVLLSALSAAALAAEPEGLLVAVRGWGTELREVVVSPIGRRVLSSAVTITLVVSGAVVLWHLASRGVERWLARFDCEGAGAYRTARARTLLPLARNVLFVALVVMVVLIVLSEVGINIAPLLAGAGVVGIAIGFGAQKLVQDVITGAFILFENTIAIGDVVKLDGHAGVVEGMSIRAIRLRDITGAVHTIPFGSVGTVVNMTRDFSYALIDAGVAYREDIDRVVEVLSGIAAELALDPELGPELLEPLEVMGVDRFEASAVVVRVRLKTQPGSQWKIGRAFNRRMKQRFDELGIEIPFPQTTLWFGDKVQVPVKV